MSKKGKGIKKLNKAQQTSAQEKPLTSGIKRVDRLAQSQEAAPKKTVQRRDKNATATEPVKKKAVSRRDKNATSKESSTKKKVVRRNPNAKVAIKEEPKKVTRRDKNATVPVKEKTKKGIARSGKMHATGHDQGLEKPKVAKKKGGTSGVDSQTRSTEESSSFRKIKTSKMHSQSKGEEIKPKKKGGRSGGAFSTTTETAKPKKAVRRTGKMNQTSSALGLDKEKKVASTKKAPKGGAHHTGHTDIFGGGKKTSAPKTKNVGHMESSFTFG